MAVYGGPSITIRTGVGSATDIGTLFSVAHHDDDMRVAVREGRVDVSGTRPLSDEPFDVHAPDRSDGRRVPVRRSLHQVAGARGVTCGGEGGGSATGSGATGGAITGCSIPCSAA